MGSRPGCCFWYWFIGRKVDGKLSENSYAWEQKTVGKFRWFRNIPSSVIGTRRINLIFMSKRFSIPLTSESVTSGQAGVVFRQLFLQCVLLLCCAGFFGLRGPQWQLGLGISDKKIIPRKTELTEQMVISNGIQAVPRNRISRNSVPNPSAEEKTSRNFIPRNRNRSKLSEFPSETFSRRETTGNSVPRNRNRSKLLEFPSEPFSGRENNSEFRSEPFPRRENNSEKTRQRQSPTVLKLKVIVETVRIGLHHPC